MRSGSVDRGGRADGCVSPSSVGMGEVEGDGEVARDGKVDADVMAAVVYSMTVRGFMGRSVCVRVSVLQGDEGADAG